MVDPITLTAIGTALGGAAGVGSLAMSIADKPKTPNIPPAAPPIQNPVGTQTSNAPSGNGPSFLAGAVTPQQGQTAGGRSLLGQ